MSQISNMEPDVNKEGFWPPAIFIQNKMGTNFLIYIEEIYEAATDLNEDVELLDVIKNIIKTNSPEYLAVVYKAEYTYDDEYTETVVSLLVGDITDLEYYEADCFISDNKYKLENWEAIHTEDFPEEAQIIRRSMVYQDQ